MSGFSVCELGKEVGNYLKKKLGTLATRVVFKFELSLTNVCAGTSIFHLICMLILLKRVY